LRRAVKETLAEEGIAGQRVEVSILLVDDAAIQALNARYRGKDEATDVLSFTQEDAFVIPGEPRILGDVVVSIDTATRQAAAGGRSLEDEVAQLIIHGVLHLLGYDDVTTKGYAEMVEKGARIWERAGKADA